MIITGVTGRRKPKTNSRFFTITKATKDKAELTELKGQKIIIQGLENNKTIDFNKTLLSLRGKLTETENVFHVEKVENIAMDSNVEELLEASSLLGIQLNKDEFSSLKQKLAKISLVELLEEYRANKDLLIDNKLTTAENTLLTRLLTNITKNDDFNITSRLLQSADASIDYPQIASIYNALKNRAKNNEILVSELIKQNPYILTQVLPNFNTASLIAERMAEENGMFPEARSINLCASKIISILRNNEEQGNAFIWRNVLYGKLLGQKFTFETINRALNSLLNDNKYRKTFGSITMVGANRNNEILVQIAEETGFPRSKGAKLDNDRLRAVYLTSTFMAEQKGVEGMDFLKKPSKWNVKNWDEKVEQITNLDKTQKEFLKLVPKNRITLLTGGPGTGKTTTLKELIKLTHDIYNETPIVLAPTALAAFRAASETVSESHASQTIHRYAKIFTDDADLIVNMDHTPTIITESRLLIIDEASMLTPFMWRKIINTVQNNDLVNIVIAGDDNQLEPVGAGGVFPGLLRLANHEIPNITKISLETYYRGDKYIYDTIQAILNDEPLPLNENIKKIEARNNMEIKQSCIAEVEKLIQTENGFNPESIMILTPYRYGTTEINSNNLNRFLQEVINPVDENTDTNYPFRVGNLVVATTNDYQESPNQRKLLQAMRIKERPDIFNGSKGKVVSIQDNIVTIKYKVANTVIMAKYNKDELPYYVELAYALTVHKAQGGQAKHIVYIVPNKIPSKSSVYTAISRCSQGGTITIIGKPDLWENELKEVPVLSRFYHLAFERYGHITKTDPVVYDFEGFDMEITFL